jgi:hypothetical protein
MSSSFLSRSTNFLYLKPMVIFYDRTSKLGLYAAPRVWAYVANSDDTHPDLSDYRGYFDVEMKFGKADSFVMDSHLGWAKEGGSPQLDRTYPLHHLFFDSSDLYVQPNMSTHSRKVRSITAGGPGHSASALPSSGRQRRYERKRSSSAPLSI